MKFIIAALLISLSTLGFAASAPKAPDFELKGHDGKTYRLKDLKGKVVVLEWYNEGCPFVRKFYDAGVMQKYQQEFSKRKDVVWLTVSSSAKKKQGYIADEKMAQKTYEREKMGASSLLLDAKGIVGRAYQAKTTPHMFIINKEGMLAYNGAIDSVASTLASDITKAEPFFKNTLDSIVADTKIGFQKNKPYGCSVKY